MTKNRSSVLVIGAGPAGLTAAYELATRSEFDVTLVESTNAIGGISQTVNYKGNRIDIGGHRFFSKCDRVMDWWFQMLPLDPSIKDESVVIRYQNRIARVECPRF